MREEHEMVMLKLKLLEIGRYVIALWKSCQSTEEKVNISLLTKTIIKKYGLKGEDEKAFQEYAVLSLGLSFRHRTILAEMSEDDPEKALYQATQEQDDLRRDELLTQMSPVALDATFEFLDTLT